MKSSWFKILLLFIPVLILIFFYIENQQHNQHVVVKKQSLAFSRDWNDFNYQFTGKKVYKKRAEKRQKQLNEQKKYKIKFQRKISTKNLPNFQNFSIL